MRLLHLPAGKALVAATLYAATAFLLPALAHAQNNTTSKSKDAQQETTQKPEEKPKSPETIASANAAELDALLLGAWVFLGNDGEGDVTNETAEAAGRRCFKNNGEQSSTGDIVYFRSSDGLQRLDTKDGAIFPFTELKKVDGGSRGTIWAIRGGDTALALQIVERGRGTQKFRFMLEETRIYLRCSAITQNN